MSDVVIRPMTEADLPAVTQVFLVCFNAAGEEWSLETAQKQVKESFAGDCHYVACVGEQIVGCVLGFPMTREQGTDLFIDVIAILPEFQYQKIGTQLWSEAVAYAKRHQLHGLRLLANRSFSSFAWYQRMGFSESGWVELHKAL